MMNSKKGSELQALLSTIKLNDDNDPNANGIPADLWGCLPDQAAGQAWASYVANVALEVADILAPEGDYTFDDLTEALLEYSDNAVPAYYYEQFKEIADLNLWAINEIEENVDERLNYDPENPLNLRSMMPFYCAAAYEITYLAICNYVMGEESGE
jgi:hypothetical protein